MADIETARSYCRLLPEDGDEVTLRLCYDAAIAYLEGAGVPLMADSALYDLAVYMLTGTWYDARGTMAIGQVPAELGRTVQSIILQLRYHDAGGGFA